MVSWKNYYLILKNKIYNGLNFMIKIFKSKKNPLDDLNFLSFVSHELKTPLSTLKLNVELLKNTISEEEKKLVKIMEEEVDWMIQFISDTLDSRKTNNKAILNLGWHKWNKWIQTIQDSMEKKVNPYGKKLQFHLSGQETEVYMDPLYMRQVLLNLIMNAVEYSFEKSTIEISWEQTEKGELSVHVMDQGPGIKPENKNKIFEPFYREREKVDTVIKGSGLGLTIVKKIVQAHDGNIYALNRSDDKGALFIFTIPQTQAIFE